jgi:phosphomannomutase/phosphoglucomutase
MGTEALYGDDIQQLRDIYEQGQFASGNGGLSERAIIPAYLSFLQEHFAPLKDCGLRVVIDCGNGAASLVAQEALQQLGCQVTGLFCHLDGHFPNHHPDPTVMENLVDLIETVKVQQADVGIGYDGDADRIGVIDDQGKILWGDRLLLLFARDVLREHPGCTIISEVKASQGLYDDIQKRGGRAIMWKTGHSVMKAKMKEEHALLAGEMSGHVFFADRYYGYDDAIYASCRLIEILAKHQKPLSALLADIPQTVVTPEIRVECADEQKFSVVESVKKQLSAVLTTQHHQDSALPIREIIATDGLRVCFDEGWGLIRASNTQPALVLRFEASSEGHLSQIREFLERQLADAKWGFST